MTTLVSNCFLLGVMHGHWDLDERQMNSGFLSSVNVGIAIVAPAWRLLELINDPALVAMRDKNDSQVLQKLEPRQ